MKKIVKYIDFEVVGKYHYPLTAGSLAFITCDREAACGNVCKDTFPTESRRGTCFTLTRHASAFSHKPAGWRLLSPALGTQRARPALVFLLPGASRCWPKVYHAGLWVVIQPCLSPFSLLEQTFASASFHCHKFVIISAVQAGLLEMPSWYSKVKSWASSNKKKLYLDCLRNSGTY